MNDASIGHLASDKPTVRRGFGSLELVVLLIGVVSLLDAGYIILMEAFVESSHYSNRSLALPAMGLAFAAVTYLLARLRSRDVLLRIILWPFAVFICYLGFGAALLAISVLVRLCK